MRNNAFVFALMVCTCGLWTPDGVTIDPHASLSQRSITDISSAAKQKRVRNPSPASPVGTPRRFGPADPSFGPDGKPYPVPEYLRGQCYIDNGYGRFSSCSNV